jgi:asparagine synthase (glutamine-hydrolysing)
MCGIIAHLSFDNHPINQAELSKLNDLLTHRGPDDSGVFTDGSVSLAMRRLSIVDLKNGHQPMSTTDGRYTIVFNGEIYNHGELRDELIKQGIVFATQSDTEVLLQSFAFWGKDVLSKLNGMFAFAIWDKKTKELFVARDRMGEKPLYFAHNDKHVMFASELTPVARSGFFDLRYDYRAISDYLSYWYVCEPRTLFAEIKQLPPAHYAVVKGDELAVTRYWQIPIAAEDKSISFAEAATKLDSLLNQAVRLRLKADVPFGTFLSGGIDSGLVTAMAVNQSVQKLQSFAIGFKEESYDETPLAKLTARRHGVDLNVHVMEEITPGLIEEIILAFDEPLGNASYVPSYLLARAARAKMKMVLTGDGGDELFGGYPTYQAPHYQNLWRRLPSPVRTMVKELVPRLPVSHKRISLDYRLKQLMQGIDLDYRRAHYTWREVTSLHMQKDLWKKEHWQTLAGYDPFEVSSGYFDQGKGLSVGNQLMFADLNTYLLNDHLRKVDRMTMAHGLEARLPFMDHHVVEFAMSLPDAHKVNISKTKRILKKVAESYLPKEIIQAKKKGLTSPIAGWICHELKDYFIKELQGGLIEKIFEQNAVKALLDDHLNLRKDNSRPLWALLTLQVWARKYEEALL